MFENQLGTIDSMEKIIEKTDKTYRRIPRQKLAQISTWESRQILEGMGVKGQVVVTDYCSPDSITFVSDEGEAIVGALPRWACRVIRATPTTGKSSGEREPRLSIRVTPKPSDLMNRSDMKGE